ncbi:MAG: DNA internalization-related competence protein ComEC/Rec2 [Firmicutes bacterium]|nr:DNA internalization-related competence protein ComEC/Rec2 [Bacillota bacterium]
MTRPLIWLTLMYVSGIILGRYFSPYIFIFASAAALIWSLYNIINEKKGVQTLAPFLLLFLVAGGLVYSYSLQRVQGNIRDYCGERCLLVGTVEDEPLWREDDVVFTLRAEKIRLLDLDKEDAVTGKVRVTLRWKEKNEMPAELSYGQEVSLQGKLYEPKGRRNPGGFDYRFYLETEGMAASFYGPADGISILGFSDQISALQLAALKLKSRMSAVLRAYLPRREGALLVGMLFGERNALDEETIGLFSKSGIAHLLAVSGLHVGLVAGAVFLLGRRFGLQGWAAYLFTALLLVAYVYLCGLAPSALRALIMVLLAMGAVQLGRPGDLPTSLAAAALFTLVFNPFLLFTISFQLSYAATGAILFLAPLLQEKITAALDRTPLAAAPSLVRNLPPMLAVTLAAQLGVLPLTALYFRQVSLVALLANLFVLPVMSLVMSLGLASALLGLLWPLAGSLLNLANYLPLSYLLYVAALFGSLPFSYCEVYPPYLSEIIIFYAFLALLAGGWRIFLPLYNRLKHRVRPFYLLVSLLLPVLFITWWGLPVTGFSESELEIVFLDVGQGDAIFIRTPQGHNILLDGGGKPAYTGNIDETGRFVVVPFLEHRRIKKLDMVIVSHPHEDHYGGLFAVLEKFPVKRLVTTAEVPETKSYSEFLESAHEMNISREIVREGDIYTARPFLEMKALSPPEELFSGTGNDSNNNSLVLHLRYKEVGFLFTGDIETSAVDYLLSEQKIPAVQILKVPHHGGNLGNLRELLDSASPCAAVISVGTNSFGHPHTSTLAGLEDSEVEVYRTDLHGAVIIRSNGFEYTIETMLVPQPAL